MRFILLLLLPLLFLGADYPVKYPENVDSMTDSEFQEWATKKNNVARKNWDSKFKDGYQYNYGSKTIVTSEVIGFNTGGSTITPTTITNDPGKSASSTKIEKHSVPYRYNNPDFKHPGPLTLVNPYVKPKNTSN